MNKLSLALFFFLSSLLGETLAFSTSPTRKHSLTLWSSPTSENGEAAQQLVPHPPEVSPMVDEQLQVDLMESERRIMMFEAEINLVREQLDMAQDELQEERNSFRDEKKSLLSKITNFTTILSQRDLELEQQQQMQQSPEQLENVNNLIGQVTSLSSELDAKTREYMQEKEATRQLRLRFEKAQDDLEFEQMRFEKEKQALKASIEQEKKSLRVVEDQMKQNKASYDATKQELLEKIQQEQGEFENATQSWTETELMMKSVEKELRESLLKKEELLAESKKELTEKDSLQSELSQVKKDLATEEDKTQRTIDELLEVRNKYRTEKSNLEQIIKREQTVIEEQKAALEEQTLKYEKDQTRLETKLSRESERLQAIEKELASERDTFSIEKERLEKQIAEEVRVRQLKARTMNDRYTQVRKEMTQLWEDTKRQSRREEARLKRKYEKKLSDVKKNVVRLEGQVQDTSASNAELHNLLNEARQENDKLNVSNQKIEQKYKTLLSSRDDVILRQTKVIDEQKAAIDGYESSFRLLAKLSVRVTGRKIKNMGDGLKRILSNSKDEESSE